MNREELKNLAYNRKWIAGDAYNEDNPLVSLWLDDFCELVQHLGWHPASEKPTFPKGKNWVRVFALVSYDSSGALRPAHLIYKDKGWSTAAPVIWWCYPPMEE